MIDSIKITSLNNIGSNLSANTIFPVVNAAVPVTNKANLQIIGNLILSGAGGLNFVQAAQATLAQSVVNSAQPNITSVGTLSINTLRISGGVNGYILKTDGTGNLAWISPTSTVSGSDTQVQFNNAGSFGSSANFTYDNGNNILNVIRANASYLTAYESVSTANLAANGLATIARINVTNTANLGPVGNITITGGSNGQVLTTNGNGVLSWTNDANSSYGDSNVVSLMAAFGSNTINTTGNVTANYFNGVATDVLVEAVNNNYSYHMAFVTGSGDTTLHMDNDDNLQYNPVYGLMTVNRTDMQYLSVANSVLTSLVPFDSLPLDLGNATNPWQDIYLSNSTIYLGNATISANGNSIVVDSITVGGNVGTIGNIANINLTGSNTNVLYGNGVFAAVAGGGNTGNVTFSDQIILGTGTNDGGGGLYLAPGNDSIANSAVQYLRVRGGDAPTHIHLDTGNNAYYDQYFGADSRFVKLEANGNVVINADDYAANYGTWTFGTDGSLTLPIGVSIDYNGNVQYPKIIADSGKLFSVQGQGNSGSAALAWTVDPNAASQYAAVSVSRGGGDDLAKVILQAQSDSGNVATAKTWQFSETGNLTLPGNLVIAGNTSVFGTDAALIQSTDDLRLLTLSSGANGAVSSVWVEDIGNVGTSNIAAVYANPTSGSKIVRIVVGQNGVGSGPNLWDFGNDGNLTLPTSGQIIVSGGLVSSGASPAPTINGFSITNSVGISGNGNVAGGNISATGNITANNFVGNGGSLSNVATSTTGNWTLAPGVNTVSLSVPLNGTYSIWVRGNIPNGIVTYTATAVVTNNNVPVLGSSYGWYYEDGNALVLTSIPTQFVGTVNNISNASISTTTANVFTFGITNNSGTSQVVNWGYTKL